MLVIKMGMHLTYILVDPPSDGSVVFTETQAGGGVVSYTSILDLPELFPLATKLVMESMKVNIGSNEY